MTQLQSQTHNNNFMPAGVEIGALYKHYSGKLYRVIALARDSEDPTNILVIYQGQQECPTFGHNPTWARPYTMFTEEVTIEGVKKARFEKLLS